MSTAVEARPKPVLHPEFCKGCGRCIEACAVHHCIAEGQEIHAQSGLVPVAFHPEDCNGCNLCVEACPEPYALMAGDADPPVEHPVVSRQRAPAPEPVPDERVAVAEGKTLVVKGAHAAAIGALLAGCRHFFGYPITPSTEGAELMAKLLPRLGGTFLQAVSEVAAVNMMYGCGGAGKPCMTFTSSPGFSLMLEGVSYLIGSEIPGVIVNVMRAGPGLGNIGPAQADLKLTCRGLGHGATHAIALVPSTPQEMLDHAMLAFELSMKYRNPVVILADGYLGQMTGRVQLPGAVVKPGMPAWAVSGDAAHRRNVHTSIYLNEADQEAHDEHILSKYAAMAEAEQLADLYRCEDAEVLLVACNTPARMAKGAVRALRDEGIAAGLFRPQTVWPFPVKMLLPLLPRVKRFVVVEASEGQLEDELRLALSHARAGQDIPIDHVRRQGGFLPSQREILEGVRGARPARAAARKVVTA